MYRYVTYVYIYEALIHPPIIQHGSCLNYAIIQYKVNRGQKKDNLTQWARGTRQVKKVHM